MLLDPPIQWLQIFTFIIWMLNALIAVLLFVIALIVVWCCCAEGRKFNSQG